MINHNFVCHAPNLNFLVFLDWIYIHFASGKLARHPTGAALNLFSSHVNAVPLISRELNITKKIFACHCFYKRIDLDTRVRKKSCWSMHWMVLKSFRGYDFHRNIWGTIIIARIRKFQNFSTYFIWVAEFLWNFFLLLHILYYIWN